MRIEASSLQGNHFFASSSLLKPRRVHKSCGDMSQCTSIGSADASISRRVECKGTCNQGNVLESATRTQKTAYFSMAFAQERAEKNFAAGKKAEKGSSLVTEDQRHPAHNPRSLPVCVLASFRKQRAGLARSRQRRGAKLGVLRPAD